LEFRRVLFRSWAASFLDTARERLPNNSGRSNLQQAQVLRALPDLTRRRFPHSALTADPESLEKFREVGQCPVDPVAGWRMRINRNSPSSLFGTNVADPIMGKR